MKTKIQIFIIIMGLGVTGGCVTSSGPLATLPMTSPAGSAYNLEGIKLFNRGKWQEASAQFERAIQADAELAEAHFNLALSLHNLGQHGKARREFKIAGELAPNNRQIVNTAIYRNHLGLSSTFERHISGGYRYE